MIMASDEKSQERPVIGNFERKIPDGDNRHRDVCVDCGFVNYENPKIVVGSVCRWGAKILLCRRAINPRKGHWTLPAGYLEQHETTMAGAEREAWEEAQARIAIDSLLAVYTIPRLSQVQLIYRARLISDQISAGPESLEVGLFDYADIPWDDLAFPSVHWALGHYHAVASQPVFATFTNPAGEVGDL